MLVAPTQKHRTRKFVYTRGNDTGVIMHLVAKRTGLMLSLGGDAIVIRMKQCHRRRA